MTSRHEILERICRERGLLAVYLFGSRADDGLRLLRGDTVPAEGSDLDIGIVFRDPSWSPGILSWLQVDFEDLFEPLRIDLVPLQRVDALFQFNAIDGHRVAVTDPDQADRYELAVMSRAEELLPIQRQIEIEMFGMSNIDEIVRGLHKG
jgi:predicted nucleotidyltransferase